MKFFTYHKTRCFFVENQKKEILAIDAGWPCSFFEYCKYLKEEDLHISQVKYCVLTHTHLDHAGLVSEFLERGIQVFVTQEQKQELATMERVIAKNTEYSSYKPINSEKLQLLSFTTLKEFLTENFQCTVFKMPHHSPDSLVYQLNETDPVIGDLAPIDQIMKSDVLGNKCWEYLIEKGIKTVYPSHAPIFSL